MLTPSSHLCAVTNIQLALQGKFSFVEVVGAKEGAWPVPVANSASMASFLAVALDKYNSGARTTRVYPISENLAVNEL